MTLSPCCQVSFYADPVCVVGGKPVKIRIGEAARCSKCHKLFGDFRADRVDGEAKRLQGKFGGTAWALMIDKNIKGACPLNFEMRGDKLVPENWVEPQTEMGLDEEVPF